MNKIIVNNVPIKNHNTKLVGNPWKQDDCAVVVMACAVLSDAFCAIKLDEDVATSTTASSATSCIPRSAPVLTLSVSIGAASPTALYMPILYLENICNAPAVKVAISAIGKIDFMRSLISAVLDSGAIMMYLFARE